MRYIFLIVGLLLVVGAMASPNLFYLGLVFMFLSFIFSTHKNDSITKIEDKRSLSERLDKFNINVPDKSLSNLVEDAMAVTAKITKGEKPDVSAKNIVKGTVKTIDGFTSVFKNN